MRQPVLNGGIMFRQAVPVFADGKDKEKHYCLVLCESAESLKDTVMYISAFSFYRLTVNGKFVAFGPARTAKGYARVDEIALSGYDSGSGENEIIIEVVGHYCNSLSTVKQPSFVVAELCRGDEVLLCTGRNFIGYRSERMIQKVERYSAQRHFGEIHNYASSGIFGDRIELTPSENTPIFLPRRAPYPNYDIINAELCAYVGDYFFDDTIPFRNTRSSFPIDEVWGRYEEDEVFSKPYRWIQRQRFERKGTSVSFPKVLSKGEYAIVDMGRIETGFIGIDAKALDHSEVVIGYTEACFEADFEFSNINAQNVIELFIEDGESVHAESFEPYTCKVAIIMVKEGSIELCGFSVRTFEYPQDNIIKREVYDKSLAKIYRAAERTFAHNAVDLYTDCPSRERAGWLCDSFFTGKVEHFLTGKTLVEDAFLENYRLYENEGELPVGILPMCYPSDLHDNNKFIPQWDMWYVLEVKEYLTERNTSVDREIFRKSVEGIINFLARYENADGLLQNLPSWNFVEWSTANEWVQDVNYPTNFLYAEVLRAAYALYGDETLIKKAEKVAHITAEKAFDGDVFVDNAILVDGVLENTRNSSEAGQYYAILFGNIDVNDEKYSRLKTYVENNFENFDAEGRGFVPVNAFIGLYLRVLVLLKLGKLDLLEDDIKNFFGGMVDTTGTLWEYKQHKGSYDHGFASFVAIAINEIDKNKKLTKRY